MNDKYLNRGEALRYLRFSGEPEGEFLSLLEKCERELSSVAAPVYTYKVFERDEIADFLVGEDVKKHIEGCGRVILFAATLGISVDRAIKKMQLSGAASAMAFDAVASAYIEEYCAWADSELAEAFAPMALTWRFSPGYGDFSIELQGELIRLAEADKKTGILVTESSMLLPVKSVTAVIGLSDTPVKKGKQTCAACNMKDTCAFRKEGKHCG